MKHIIVGNGIVALATAFRLIKNGLCGVEDVVVIGRQDRQGCATLAAAAMLNSFAEIESGAFDNDVDRIRFALSRKASSMWPKFEFELLQASGQSSAGSGGLGLDFGTYIINNAASDSLDDENFNAIVGALDEYEEPYKIVDPLSIPNYAPAQRYRAIRALLIENEGWINPRLTINALDVALNQSSRVLVIDQNAIKFTFSGDRITGVLLEDQSVVTGDTYLLATGATASDFLSKSGIDIGMQRVFYGVGASIEIKSPEFPHLKCIRTPNRGLACGVYSAPFFQGKDVANDRILIGASNFISPVPYSAARLTSIESLSNSAIQQINGNFYRADFIRLNVGWRPTSQDTYPLIGKSSINNLFIATGTKRDGFFLAPLISEYLSSIMRNEQTDGGFDIFSPCRRPIRTLTRAQAVSKAVKHHLSAAYQHGYAPSKSRMPEQIIQMFKDNVERLHDKVGAYDWGIPPEMLDMYRYGHAKF